METPSLLYVISGGCVRVLFLPVPSDFPFFLNRSVCRGDGNNEKLRQNTWDSASFLYLSLRSGLKWLNLKTNALLSKQNLLRAIL